MRICFFARVRDKAYFDVVEFYRVDIGILRGLGHEVVCVNDFRQLLIEQFDLYYIWWFGYGVFPALIARLRGVPSIAVGAVHTIDCGGLKDWPLHKRLLMMLTMRCVDRSVFISHVDWERVGSFKPNSPSVAYCAVDLEEYCSVRNEREDLVVTITHLTVENVRRKMLLQALGAFSIFSKGHPSFQFHICGSFGDGVGLVQEEVARLGLADKVVLRGRLTGSEKIDLLQRACIYLQPSSCEGFGLAILEAQACGVPVVTTRETCIVEINGDNVLYGDTTAALSERLSSLIEDGDLYHEMRARGKSNVCRYSVGARREAIGRVINELLSVREG